MDKLRKITQPLTCRTGRANELYLLREAIINSLNEYKTSGKFTSEEVLGCLEIVKQMVVEQERGYQIDPDGSGPRTAGVSE